MGGYVDPASIVVDEWGPTLDERFDAFDDYHSRWSAEAHDPVWSNWLERSNRMELAPLSDGRLRRRGLRQALVAEWASVAQKDALAALQRVHAPALIVHADADWGDKPCVDVPTIRAQAKAAHDPHLYVAHGLHHSDIVRRPNDELIQAIKAFVSKVAG